MGNVYDPNTYAAQNGQSAAAAVSAVLMVMGGASPGGWAEMLSRGQLAAEVAGTAWTGVEALQAGDAEGAVQAFAQLGMTYLSLANVCGLPSFLQFGVKLLHGISLVQGVINAYGKFQEGDTFGGFAALVGTAANIYAMMRSCFAAGTKLLDVEGGKSCADAIKVGDRLWSRNEFEPDGPVELKEVEEVFTRVAPILNVHVAGQIIRTTGEHPFYVEGQGWVGAGLLQIGDLLRARDGALVAVEGVADSGLVETVYNWRRGGVSYVLRQRDRGRGVDLAHNACSPGRSGKQARLRQLLRNSSTSRAVRGWIKQELNAIARGQRSNIRVPKGFQLAHRRGFEARYGFGYGHSDLQNIDLHRLQHRFEGY